jgi:hypothetical protein
MEGFSYPWSTYTSYLETNGSRLRLPEMEEILSQFGNYQNAVRRFEEYHGEEEAEPFLDVPEKSGENAEGLSSYARKV